MNFLDWCLILLTVVYAISGYWQGFIAGSFATAGLLLGGLAGIWLAPVLLGDAAPSLWVSLGALSVVAVLLVAWMLGVAISGSRIPGISPQVRDSRVLVAVNNVMPVQAQQA